MKLPRIGLKNVGKPKESKLFLALLPAFQQKKTQQFTTLALTFVTIAFFGLFAVGPTLGTIADLQKQLDDRNFVNTQLQNKIANLTSLQTQYTLIQPNLGPVLAAIPATSEVDTFIGQVHQLALTSNIQLNRTQTLPFSITANPQKNQEIAFAFSIEGQGTLSSLENFVNQLSTLNRLISFTAVGYARNTGIALNYRVTIRGSTYFLPGE